MEINNNSLYSNYYSNADFTNTLVKNLNNQIQQDQKDMQEAQEKMKKAAEGEPL